MDIAPGTQDWCVCVSAILVSIVKSEEKLSYWGLAKHFDEHPQRPKTICAKYSRSMYQLRISDSRIAKDTRLVCGRQS